MLGHNYISLINETVHYKDTQTAFMWLYNILSPQLRRN